MSHSKPTLRSLQRLLANLSPNTVEKLSDSLDVPRRVFEESQANHPRNAYRWKTDALQWWIDNKEATWEEIATALESPEVGEGNLAGKVRSEHGLRTPSGEERERECVSPQLGVVPVTQ